MSSVEDFIGSERVLEVSSQCHIRFQTNSFVAEGRQDGRRMTIPSGDVLALVLESEMATLSVATLSACGERGIPVVVCRKHLPVSLSLPIGIGWNTAQVRRAQAQALRGETEGRRLWQHTVQCKLLAQATLLEQLRAEHWRRVRRLADDVGLDGQETVEAQGAAIYWRALFAGFRRSDDDDRRNMLLNWGYAVLLAAIGRALVAHGFDPALGFGHASRTNPWALASDLMEPFRPTIDAAVAAHAREPDRIDAAAAKAAILRPFANDGPAKRAIVEAVHGYRAFLAGGGATEVRYPGGPLGP